MEHATEAPPETSPTVGPIADRPQRCDPTKDVDAKTTSIVLVASTVFVFGTVWLLSYVFAAVIQNERVERVERAPNDQLDTLRAREQNMLKSGVDPRRKSIEASIQELATPK